MSRVDTREILEHTTRAHPYEIAGSVLEHVDQEKDLGVIIDCELNFEEHIYTKIKKANSIVGLINRSFDFLSPEMLRTLFMTFVRHHLEYAQAVWSPRLIKHSDAIESVQRRATRLVSGYRNRPYEERLRIMNLPSLKIRRKIGDMVEVYKHLMFMINLPYVRNSFSVIDLNVNTISN